MAKSADIGASYSRKGKLSGLWSGLTFRVPHFLMTANSRWVAIGLALGYLISVPLLILLMGSLNFVLHLSPILNTLLSLSVTFLVALLAWRHFHRFVAQRLFIASSIIALTCCALAYMLVVLAYLSLASLTHIPEPDYEQWPVFLVPFLVGLPALSFVYALWRMWRAR